MKGNCGECNLRWACDMDPNKCNDWPDPVPMTNAQKIRAMSDEELATFISEIADECERNTECNQHCYGCDIEYCVRESCLKWLQRPAEEDKHETCRC